MRNYHTNKIFYNHIDDIWSIDLADSSDYKTLNNKSYRYIFVITDKFSEFFWTIPLKSRNSQTTKKEFSKIFHNIKRKTSQIGI